MTKVQVVQIAQLIVAACAAGAIVAAEFAGVSLSGSAMATLGVLVGLAVRRPSDQLALAKTV